MRLVCFARAFVADPIVGAVDLFADINDAVQPVFKHHSHGCAVVEASMWPMQPQAAGLCIAWIGQSQ